VLGDIYDARVGGDSKRRRGTSCSGKNAKKKKWSRRSVVRLGDELGVRRRRNLSSAGGGGAWISDDHAKPLTRAQELTKALKAVR